MDNFSDFKINIVIKEIVATFCKILPILQEIEKKDIDSELKRDLNECIKGFLVIIEKLVEMLPEKLVISNLIFSERELMLDYTMELSETWKNPQRNFKLFNQQWLEFTEIWNDYEEYYSILKGNPDFYLSLN